MLWQSNKPAYKAPECKGLNEEGLHNLLTGAVNAMEYGEEEDYEEGFVKTAAGECEREGNKGRRTPDNSCWI
jgi:hypothetical protein